ncbi:MAG: ABC transporter ATP-binding protein [Anaerolineales bacterium]|nr:ABC transporter ATP-binding protein [Anaerolineales bacterium]
MKHLLRLKTFLKPYAVHFTGNLLLLLSITAMSLVVPRIIQQVIDRGLTNNDRRYLGQAALLLLGIGLVTAVLSFFQRYLTQWISAHVGMDLRNRLFNHIQRLSFSFHDHSQSGQIISRCIEDVSAIERFAGTTTVEMVQLILLSIGILGLMLNANPKLASIALLPLLPLIGLTVNLGTRIGDMFVAVDRSIGEVTNRLQENVTGVQVVRAFAREDYEIKRFNQANMTVYHTWVKVMDEWAKVMPSTRFLINVGTILLLWFGGVMVLRGEITVGEIVAFNAYLLMLSTSARQLAWLINSAGEASAGTKRIFEVLDTPIKIQSPSNAIVPTTFEGKVEFRHVSLTYQDEKHASLQDIVLAVEPNQIVALIGPTGSGKTSLVNLIPRFYDVSSGAVLIDNHDIRKLDLVTLRRQIGIVLQTSLLFSDTIRANIAYGQPDASEDEIIAAAKAAQADEFILQLPNGYDTIIGERGITLSGGQRQRIAIARALLMNPRILILDDSTSSVDTQTELLIQKALEKLMEGRTTFIIAHRVTTVRHADLILVMDKGHIVQRGTHDQLINQGGLYNEIYELQLKQHARYIEEIRALPKQTIKNQKRQKMDW